MTASKPTIGLTNFVRRQTAESEFTHFNGDLDDVAILARHHFDEAVPSTSHDDGVLLVPVPALGFYTGVVELQEGDKLVGEYKARRPGEEPRKVTRLDVQVPMKSPAVAVDVVLYRRDLLLEDNDGPSTDCDWEIVSINGRITEEDQPIHPDTLIANHFGLDGGSKTGYTPEQFEAALRKSVLYWKNKAMLPGAK